MVKTVRKHTRFQKTILAASLGIALGVGFSASLQSYADLNSVLGGMLFAAGGPGVYQTQQGMTLSGGYADISVPQQNYNIISFAPPSISGGCGGINLFMGSFSFINAKQFEQLLENIGEGLLVYAFYSAISAMCSQCSAILQSLEEAAQAMNSLTKNTCNLNAGVAIDNAMQGLASAATNFDKAVATQVGDWSGMFSADQSEASSPTSTFSNMWNTFVNNLDVCGTSTATTANGQPYTVFTCNPAGGNAQGQGGNGSVQVAALSKGIGNNTWRALRHSQAQEVLGDSAATIGLDDHTTMEILMSILGAKIIAPPSGNGAQAVNSQNSGSNDQNTLRMKGIEKPGILQLSQLVQGNPDTNFYVCEQGEEPNGNGYFPMYNGTFACLNLDTQNFQSINYVGIRNYVHGMLLGGYFAFPGATPANHNGIAYNIINHITLPQAEQNFINNCPLPILVWANEINQDASIQSPSAQQADLDSIYQEASHYIVADYAASFGRAVLEAAEMAFNTNNHKILPPPHYQSIIDTLQKQINHYSSETVGQERFIRNVQKNIQNLSNQGKPFIG